MRTDPRAPRAAGLALLVMGLAGCGLLKTTAEMPGRVASAAFRFGDGEAPADPMLVQTRFMRFADLFASEIEQATAEFAARAGTVEARVQALDWRIDYSNSLWRLASGPRPYAGLFDGIIVVTYIRHLHETLWTEVHGEADQPMVEALRRQEQALWSLTAEGLPEPYLGKVREIVATWLAGDGDTRIAEVAKLPGFSDIGAKQGGSMLGDLTGLVRLDTLAGLEPMVREVAQARQLLERIFYYLQRQPEILTARVELLTLRASQSSESQGVLASVERVSLAAESLAATAATLPASVAAEREAALTQLSAELTAQREGLVADLESARAPLVELLGETRSTAESGRAMADSLTGTLETLDAFVGRFDDAGAEGGGPPALPTAAPAAAEPGTPAKKPFDIAEYGLAAERIGVAARELEQTIATLDRSLPEVQRVLDETAGRAERAVDHAWTRALQLVGLALGGILVVTLVLRRVPPRRA